MASVPLVKSAGISVCVPDKILTKKYSILKFKGDDNVDLKTYTEGVKLERENNLREFKSANDIDLMPKSGAGSEYGREQREEARRKKFGMRSRKYNPKDQPWVFKMGAGEQSKKFRGVRSGGVDDNASYFVLMSDPSKNKFVAFPVEEWYDFSLLPNNNCLTAEQAEEEYSRRGNVHNHFAIMVNQKIHSKKIDEVQNESEGVSKKGRRKNKLLVSEFDEIDDNDENDNEDDNADADADANDEGGKSKKSKRGKGKAKGRKPKKKKGDDEEDFDKEADEESDELDEGQEMDYISGSSSDDEGMYDDDGKRDKSEVYRDGGVAEEEGLRKLVESDDDDDDEKKKNEDGNDDENYDDDEGKLDKSKDSNDASESDSTSDSEDDPDRDGLPHKEPSSSSQSSRMAVKGKEMDETKTGSTNQQSNNEKIAKRKSKTNQIVSNLNKKIKLEESVTNTSSPQTALFMAQGGSNIANDMELEIKKYLERKPMTVMALAKKIWPKFLVRMSTQNFESVMGEVIKKMALKKTSKNNETLLSIH